MELVAARLLPAITAMKEISRGREIFDSPSHPPCYYLFFYYFLLSCIYLRAFKVDINNMLLRQERFKQELLRVKLRSAGGGSEPYDWFPNNSSSEAEQPHLTATFRGTFFVSYAREGGGEDVCAKVYFLNPNITTQYILGRNAMSFVISWWDYLMTLNFRMCFLL